MLPSVETFKNTLPIKYQSLDNTEIESIRNYIYSIVHLLIKDPVQFEREQLDVIKTL